MNPKIEQLLLQVVPRAGEDGEYLPSLHTPEDIEQFARLIVKDCLSIIERRKGWIDHESDDHDYQWIYGYEKAINHCSMFIKEFFGVQE